MNKTYGLLIGVIGILVTVQYIGSNYFPNYFYLDNRPECYVSNNGNCMRGYHEIDMYYNNGNLIQCCNGREELGFDHEVLDYCYSYKTDIIDKNITVLTKQ